MVRDNRPVNDVRCEIEVDDKVTIGKLLGGILESQEETMSSLDQSLTVLWGTEIKAPAVTPKESIMSALSAILDNQKAIASAVKSIAETL